MRFLTLSFLLSFVSGLFAQNYQVIHTRKEVVADTFFQNYVIKDPYRWLEETESGGVKEWVKEQNKMAERWLRKTRRTTDSQKKVKRYRRIDFDYARKEGDYYFSWAYTDNRIVPSLLINTSMGGEDERILINPYNDISRQDHIDIRGFWASKESRFLAYQYSRNGSDWCECRVVTLPSGKHLDE
ncbi:hypothetical protein, partial [Marinilabilia sp.]